MNRDTVLEIAIAGVLLVAVIAIQGLPGEEAPAPSESSAPPPPSPVIGPRSSVAPAILEELQPGSHVIADLEPIRLGPTPPILATARSDRPISTRAQPG